jgi:hypothetical protein
MKPAISGCSALPGGSMLLTEWAKNILMTQQGATGETVELLGRRPGRWRIGLSGLGRQLP